jgi:hypothetical protein
MKHGKEGGIPRPKIEGKYMLGMMSMPGVHHLMGKLGKVGGDKQGPKSPDVQGPYDGPALHKDWHVEGASANRGHMKGHNAKGARHSMITMKAKSGKRK